VARGGEGQQGANVAGGGEGDEALVIAGTGGDDLAGDRDARQGREADEEVARAVLGAVLAGAADLADADGRERYAAARAESVEQREEDHHHLLPRRPRSVHRRKPQGHHRHEAERTRREHDVEPARPVRDQAWQPPPEDGADVEDRDQLVRESLRKAQTERVRGQVGYRDEDGPLDHEHANGGEGEAGVGEGRDIDLYGGEGAAEGRERGRAVVRRSG